MARPPRLLPRARRIDRAIRALAALLAASGLLAAAPRAALPGAAAAGTDPRIALEQMIAVPANNQLKIFESFDLPDFPSGTPLHLRLPAGHSEVQVVSSEAAGYVLSPDGLSWPHGLPPGVNSVSVTYSLPFENGRAEIGFGQRYDVDAVALLIPEGQAALIAQGLFPATQVIELEGMKFRRFTKPDLFAGVPWTATIQAIPKAGQALEGNIPVPPGLPVIGSGYKYTELKALINMLLVLFVVVLGVVGLQKRRERISSRLAEVHNELMDEWARLEWDRRRGTVDEEKYRRQRGSILRRLLAVERQQRGLGHRD
ncbi:MAG: hypothetical protein QJR06_05415 [Alicyclobacillaceae bacterium]|nr:hypothetical protein [Alicyclobacillaceae bacterium]